jgi:hypothetical protein
MSDSSPSPFGLHRHEGPVPQNVPVFDCRVIISPADAEGWRSARVANLPEITARGQNERELLRAIVTQFKAAVIRYHAQGAIPWQDPPLAAQPGDSERWIPVHL